MFKLYYIILNHGQVFVRQFEMSQWTLMLFRNLAHFVTWKNNNLEVFLFFLNLKIVSCTRAEWCVCTDSSSVVPVCCPQGALWVNNLSPDTLNTSVCYISLRCKSLIWFSAELQSFLCTKLDDFLVVYLPDSGVCSRKCN